MTTQILIVDDDQELRDLLRDYLVRQGMEVSVLHDAATLEKRLERERPDLIVLDLMMPEMDGYTVNARLMENEATRRIPVIILTAKGQMRDVFEMASNVAFYMEKPFDPKHLREKIQEVLTKRVGS